MSVVPCDDPDSDPRLLSDYGDSIGLDVPVPRIHHLHGSRQIDPQLKPPHVTAYGLWHFLMYYTAARRHPLDVTVPYFPPVTDAVTVLYVAVQDVCHSFYASVGVPWETGCVVLRVL